MDRANRIRCGVHTRTIFGRNIRRFRTELGWNQADLAEAAGIEQRHVSRLENGDMAATLDTVHTLAAALKKTGAEMLEASTATDPGPKKRGRPTSKQPST